VRARFDWRVVHRLDDLRCVGASLRLCQGRRDVELLDATASWPSRSFALEDGFRSLAIVLTSSLFI
jgi:hypothetical protein